MDRVKVIKNKEIVGYCSWKEKTGRTEFVYDPTYVKIGEELSPLIMPLNERVYTSNPRELLETFKNLPPLLADTLPDAFGNKLIAEWFSKQSVHQGNLNPVEKLAFLANRGMGALEYEPIIESKRNNGLVKVNELLEIVNQIVFAKEESSVPLNDYHQGLETLVQIGSSAGGTRAKAVIAINEETNEIKAGDIHQGKGFNYYLIKFDGLKDGLEITPQGYGIVEYTYYQIAKLCGIIMTDCKLYSENGRSHFMTQRFDRNPDGSKNHIQTVCGLTGIDFDQQGLFSYEQLHRMTLALTNDKEQVEQLFRRMVFNVIGLNNDDHIKNFSFMIKDGKWQLTPAYDLTFAYHPTHPWLKRHSIFINQKLMGIELRDILQLASDFNIKNADDIIKQTIASFQEFSSLAQQNGLDSIRREKVNSLITENLKKYF